ncbi:GGDEF domain-containing protein [Photobacterium damselae subsp. damselae]|uniref:diguanylate cyclase n=2 Tax=Photobacterium damselae TaxID=38293 RepID=A0A850QLQ8_PHODD|nr:GGDEF domain-containing protein [Photobacterium damselae subsp. damselae]
MTFKSRFFIVFALLIVSCYAVYSQCKFLVPQQKSDNHSTIYQEPTFDMQWQQWLEDSHVEHQMVLNSIRSKVNEVESLTLIEQSYLLAIVKNLKNKVNTISLESELESVSQNLSKISWFPFLIEIEQALSHWYQKDKNQALWQIEALIITAITSSYDFLLPKLFHWAGHISLNNNEILQAQKYLLKSNYYSEQQNNLFYQGKNYHSLALSYIVLGDWMQALVCIQKARQLTPVHTNTDHNRMQLYWYNESLILAQLNRNLESKAAYQQAHRHFLLGNRTLRYQALDIRSAINISMMNREFVKARELINKCIWISEQSNYTYSLGRCYLKLAKLNEMLDQYPQALNAIDLGIDYFSSLQSSYSVIKALNFKALIYDKMGSGSQAYRFAKLAYETEKRQLQNKLRDLTHAQEAFELAKQRDALDKDNRSQIDRLNQKQLYLLWAILVVIITCIVSLLLFVRARFIKKENARLEQFSSMDQLTQLPNRHFYYQQLVKGNKISLSTLYHLAVIDIDHFKSINDTHGHQVGDEILLLFAQRIKTCFYEQELFVRWGGEEFIMLINADQNAQQRIDNICHIVAKEPFMTSVGLIKVTVSIGVSKEATPKQLLADEHYFLTADAHLYQAKSNGRNQVVWQK